MKEGQSLFDDRISLDGSSGFDILDKKENPRSRKDMSAETIVIGGGVIGCSIAYELAARGQEVMLLERARMGGGTSSAAAGMLAADSEHFHHAAMAELARRSRERVHRQREHIQAMSGIDIGLRQAGFITPFRSGQKAGLYAAAYETDSNACTYWDRQELQRQAPWLSRDTYGGLYRQAESEVLPLNLVTAYAKSAQAYGARIMEGIQNVTLQTGAGRIQGVQTSIGMLTCKNVIVAAGLQGVELMESVGLNMPVVPVKGEMVAVRFSNHDAARGNVPDRTVYAEDVYIVPKANGEVWLGATSLAGASDLHVTPGGIQKLISAAAAWVPAVAHARFERAWAGVRPSTPDGLPYLGESEQYSGLYAAFGHYRNGILLSAITGSVLADLIEGKSAGELGIAAFNPERLSGKGMMH